MKLYLDRIEGDFLIFICDDKIVNFPKSLLPDAKEGQVYTLTEIDDKSEIEKQEELIDKLFK